MHCIRCRHLTKPRLEDDLFEVAFEVGQQCTKLAGLEVSEMAGHVTINCVHMCCLC